MDETYVDVGVAFTSLDGVSGNTFLKEARDITEHNRAVGNLRGPLNRWRFESKNAPYIFKLK